MPHNLFVLFIGLLCTASFAVDIPKAPAPTHASIPEFAFQNTADAQKIFLPTNEGVQAVDYVQTGDTGYVKLPLTFKGTTITRSSWDLHINADLSQAHGIEFDFFINDLNVCGEFIVYFHSVKGWYRTHFNPVNSGRWLHFILKKSDCTMEDSPEGWSEIDIIRISAWRIQDEHDGIAAIANLRASHITPDVVLMTANSCIKPGNPENKGYTQYAANMANGLEKLGIDAVTVSDLEASHFNLDKTYTVILPYNPQLPKDLVPHLQKFVARGGKIIACYSLSDPVAALLDLKKGNWTPSPTGRFNGFQATADKLPMQPDLAYQGSPHTTVATPAHLGHVIAYWQDDAGKLTNLPAITATPYGLFIGHVWIGGGKNMQQLLCSLMAYTIPGLWEKAAHKAIENMGRIGNYNDYNSLKASFTDASPAIALKEMAIADAIYEKAQKELKKKNWTKIIAMTDEFRIHALNALCCSSQAVKSEHRAFWCHSAFGLTGKTWDEAIKFLADNGFNVIHPNMLWGGVAFYPSHVLPSYADLAKRGDQVRLCLDACKKYGVECHIWKVNWNMGSHTSETFAEQMFQEKRTQVYFDGKPQKRWLCPSNPLNVRMEADAMVELVKNYPDLHGIHFDYIRYGAANVCFCDGCRQRFEARIGRKVEHWPQDCRSKALEQEWNQFRRDNITALVKTVHDEAKAVRPNIQISAALFSYWPADRDNVGQDWEMWCSKGWLDFACPMDYTDSPFGYQNQVKRQQKWVHQVPLYPGIGLSCWKNPEDPLNLIEQIQKTRELGVKGFTIFNYDTHAVYVLPFLKLGCTKE